MLENRKRLKKKKNEEKFLENFWQKLQVGLSFVSFFMLLGERNGENRYTENMEKEK